jgi:low affinity Fe/Cu permease
MRNKTETELKFYQQRNTENSENCAKLQSKLETEILKHKTLQQDVVSIKESLERKSNESTALQGITNRRDRIQSSILPSSQKYRN